MSAKPPSCEGCPLYSAPGPVWGIGDPHHAKLIYIAQNPGSEEVKEGIPLVGPSGRVFNRQLAEAGIRRSELFITNVVKCLTPGNRIPTDEEIRKCRSLIDREISACRADTVVLAGAVAFKTFIGDYSTLHPKYKPRTKKGEPVSIMERMGCVEQKDGKKWIGTLHPAHIMRLPIFRQDAIDHLKKAWAVAGIDIPLPKVEVVDDPKIIHDYSVLARDSREFADDVETHQESDVEEDDYVGGDYSMDMCGFSADRYHAIIVKPSDVIHMEGALTDSNCVVYEHNGEYERFHLEKHIASLGLFQSAQARKFDTMLAAHYLRSYAPKKLKPGVVSRYTNLPYYNRDIERVDRKLYCGLDNIATRLAGQRQTIELKEWGIYDLFMNIGMKILPELEDQRRRGVRVDVRRLLLFKKIMEAKIAKAQELIGKITGPFFNPDSPKQVAELLYDQWKLPKQYNRKEGVNVLTTDFAARKNLRRWIEADAARKSQYQQALLFLTLQDYLAGELQKISFLNRVSPDGRIHAYYKAHGERPFRLSSKPNLQNFPVYDISDWGGARNDTKDADPTGVERKQYGSLRSLVLPDHDEDLILSCDFSQVQLWIMAVRFNVKFLLDIQKSGEYIYGIVYEKLYKEPFFEAGKPKTKKYRLPISEQRMRRAKAVPLGFIFNRQAKAVADEYGWELAEAVTMRNEWFGPSMCKELVPAFAKMEYDLKQKGWVKHLYGQVMHFPSLDLNEYINSHAQSDEGFILQETMILIAEEFRRRKYENTRVMLSVHDALAFNVGGAAKHPERMVEVYEEVVNPIMRRSIPQLKGLCLDHEAKVSSMWDWETKDYRKWKEETINDARTGSASTENKGSVLSLG